MPIRFPTEAANADFLGEDADEPKSMSADGTARGNAAGKPEHFQRSDKSRESQGAQAKSGKDTGKDIHQAGFTKDKEKDSDKP